MQHKILSENFEPLLKGLSHRGQNMIYYAKILDSNTVRILSPEKNLLDINLDKGGTIGEFTSAKYGEMFITHQDYHLLGDKRKNVKGNHPIFPIFNSPLGSATVFGAEEPLANHGVARLSSCQELAFAPETQTIRLVLRDTTETRRSYPGAFEFIQNIKFTTGSLRIDFQVRSELPFTIGYHPYFNTGKNWCITGFQPGHDKYLYLPNTLSRSEKEALLTANELLTFTGFNKETELNHHFRNVSRPIRLYDYSNKRTITITSSLAQRTVFFDPQSPGLCIEPISAMSGKFGENYDELKPRYALKGYVQYTFGPL
jgi:galactose mutarotase-like enzyme